MGSVPGKNSCPFADVVTVVPSQAAACDTDYQDNYLKSYYYLIINESVSISLSRYKIKLHNRVLILIGIQAFRGFYLLLGVKLHVLDPKNVGFSAFTSGFSET